MAGATVAEIEEPEGPPARREPKLSATVSPSGSVAPSNLRVRRADLRTPQDRLAALPTVRRRGLHLAASPGGGAPARLPLAGSSATWAAVLALRPSRPTRCCLAAFPSLERPFRLAASLTPRPVPRSECFDCLERGEMYRSFGPRSTRCFRRSEHISAGHRRADKSDKSLNGRCPSAFALLTTGAAHRASPRSLRG